MTGERTFTLTVRCEGAALADDPTGEVARMLRATAAKVQDGHNDGRLLDSNGNTVGTWVWL